MTARTCAGQPLQMSESHLQDKTRDGPNNLELAGEALLHLLDFEVYIFVLFRLALHSIDGLEGLHERAKRIFEHN